MRDIEKLQNLLEKRDEFESESRANLERLMQVIENTQRAQQVQKCRYENEEDSIYLEILKNKSYLYMNTNRRIDKILQGIHCKRFVIFFEDENKESHFAKLIYSYNKSSMSIRYNYINNHYVFEVEDDDDGTMLEPLVPEFDIYKFDSYHTIKLLGFVIL